VGAGNYATGMLLPHLRDHPGVELDVVATTTALSGANAQRKFGFRTVTTDVDTVLGDERLDAVVVVTRHHSHAELVRRALTAGRAVFVEKPLAVTAEQLDGVLATVAETGNDRLMVGFNRRFAPLVTELRDRLGPVPAGGESVRYLVNAGGLAAGSWYLDAEREGSRFVGEGGHFIDTVSALVGDDPVEVHAVGGPDALHVVLRYPGGSVASIAYVTAGSSRFPKETLDVSGGGRTGRLDNFQRVGVWTARGRSGRRVLSGQDKGQKAQLDAFLTAVRTGGPMPIGLASLAATTRATLAVETSLADRRPVAL
jgi:predicted dehydrogenase